MKHTKHLSWIGASLLVGSFSMPIAAQTPDPIVVEVQEAPTLESTPEATPESTLESVEPPSDEPIAQPKPTPTDPILTKPDASSPPASEAETVPEPQRQQILIEADRLYLEGRVTEAEQLYRKAKRSFTGLVYSTTPEPILDAADLPPAGQVYWREAQAGQAQDLMTRMMVPLELLTQQYPEFLPGSILYAQALRDQNRPDQALAVLERSVTLYPNEPTIVRAKVQTLAETEQWLAASIAARQFALLNPKSPDAAELNQLADAYLDRFQDELETQLTQNAIANVFTGAVSYALTGGLLGAFTAIDSAVLLLRGESDIGESVADRAAEDLPLIEDEAVVAYVNQIGQRLAQVAGRDEFEYEFFVVDDPELNAFALPGGKVFVNAGAILQTDSEAELAGLLAHELSHAVLSHGFQLATQGNLTASVLGSVPYGGIANDLAVSSYSRDMERQADRLGTQMLATAGYAADGLHNLMETLAEQERGTVAIEWLSTHPDTQERIRNLEQQIEQSGFNRYTYEGVEQHLAIQERVQQLMDDPMSKPAP